jgi:hypothetical protein
VKYKLWNIVPFQGKGGESLLDSRALLRRSIGHSSLVDPRVWPLMNSRKLDSRYRTAWPIFTNRGPSPESRDLASQDKETLRILAASRGCSRGSIGLAFIEAFMNFSSVTGLAQSGASSCGENGPVPVPADLPQLLR